MLADTRDVFFCPVCHLLGRRVPKSPDMFVHTVTIILGDGVPKSAGGDCTARHDQGWDGGGGGGIP